MSWIKLPFVGIENGSKSVAISGASTTSINLGDALQIGNYELVEITGIYADSLELKDNWTNPSVVSGKAVVIPTFGNFNAATQALREATTVTQGNFAQMEKWWTEFGSVNFKAFDNTEHTVRTAKEMDKAVKALETGLESAVSETMARVSPANIDWDVEIDFNDGIQIKKGYGTIDANGNKVVDFSRAGTSWGTNKSGESVLLSADKPQISSGGIGLYGSAINKTFWSEDFSKAEWIKTSGVSIQQDGTTGSDNNIQLWKVTLDNTGDGRLTQNSPLNSPGALALMSVDVKKSSSEAITLLAGSFGGTAPVLPSAVFDFGIGDFTSSGLAIKGQFVEKLDNDVYRIHLVVEDNASGNNQWRFDVIRGESDVYASRASIIEGSRAPLPYIKTEGGPANRAEDIASIPLRNNMPTPGENFTIHAIFTVNELMNGGFAYGLGDGDDYFQLEMTSGGYRLQIGGGPWIGVGRNALNGEVRLTVMMGVNKKLSIYENGVLIHEAYRPNIRPYLVDSNIYIGCKGRGGISGHLNSEFKKLQICHRELTGDQVKALGGTK